MNPIDVANHLRNRYVSYLTTSFGLSRNYERLYDRFRELLETEGQLLKGPFLEGTAPYKPGASSLQSLVEAGRLHEGFRRLFAAPPAPEPAEADVWSEAAPPAPAEPRADPDRRLYVHQEKALQRLCRTDWPEKDLPHTVVASGTGSGKTECFLYPAVDWILRHPTSGGGRGVRVLLVYPMNALVNDQIRRLRHLVGDRDGHSKVPVRFARYTSETEETETKGRRKEPGAPANQLVSRERIIADPPDLLITNFAMLEQAMLRPQETPFFSRVDEHAWRFVILDEAHSYRGAQGIELARLMQRLRATVRRGKREAEVLVRDPICVATSATLSSAADPSGVTAKFAGDLFGVPFAADSVIRAERLKPAEGKPASLGSDERKKQAGLAWASLPEDVALDLDRPPDEQFKNSLASIAPPSGLEDAKNAASRRAYLYFVLKRHPQFFWLWGKIKDKPRTLAELVASAKDKPGESVEPTDGDGWAGDDPETALERLVSCCNAAKLRADDQPLLPCRYHLFASALEGVFLNLATDKEIKNGLVPDGERSVPELGIVELTARRIQPNDRKAAELARCMGCGFPFVVIDSPPSSGGLDQPPVWERPVDMFAFEPEQMPDGTKLAAEAVELALDKEAADRKRRTLYRVPPTEAGTDVARCPRCAREARYYTVASRFQTGQDAPVGVLTESLYELLPPLTDAQRQKLRDNAPGRFTPESDPIVGDGRKLLLFSDSRQNAAFMASYLQDHSVEFLMRELAYGALKPGEAPVSVEEWAARVLEEIDRRNLRLPFFEEKDLAADGAEPFRKSYREVVKEKRDRVTHYLLAEAQGDGSLGLEGLGLLAVTSRFADHPKWKALGEEVPLGASGLTASKADAKDLFERVARFMRGRHLVTTPANVERPGYSTKQQYLVKQKSKGRETNDTLTALVQKNTQPTAFADLLARWSARVRPGRALTEAEVDHLGSFVFDKILNFLFKEDFEGSTVGDQTVLALKNEALRVARPARLWRCGNCRSYATTYLGGACVERHCVGRLAEVPPEDFPANHSEKNLYVERFTAGKALEMRCEEHTAQLSPELGQEFQEAFQVGQVNVLCCSTTFEMGIDLGDLQSIVLRNVPPGPANYIQRAGRAGRRADAVAFVLTFCQRRPHDRHFFGDPADIIAGVVTPPRIDLDNRKILERHCNAETLAEYWRWLNNQVVDGEKEQFAKAGNVGLFFKCVLGKERQTPALHLARWLSEPEWRGTCVTRIREAFGLPESEAAGFLDLLATQDGPQAFARTIRDVNELLKGYEQNAEACESRITAMKAEQANAPTQAAKDKIEDDIKDEASLGRSYRKLEKQQRAETLIGFLMGRGVLPSFAFPVKEVNLHVLAQEMKSGDFNRPPRLRLKRDGRIGLADYAPGSEVVAGKHTYKSVGLRKFPALEFEFDQWVRLCPLCNHLLTKLKVPPGKDRPTVDPVCDACGGAPDDGPVAPIRWVEPKWGYVTDVKADSRKPRGRRPSSNHTTRSFYLGSRPHSGPDSEGGFDEQEENLPAGRNGFQPGISARTARGQSLLVLNLGKFKKTDGEFHRKGFEVCATCGRSAFEGKETLAAHRPPYRTGRPTCNGRAGSKQNVFAEPVALGHQYETDVAWLDCHGSGAKLEDTGFWLGLAYALVNAAAMELNIERGDLEVTTVPLEGENRQAVVIYDTVPGGAGHCRQVMANLEAVTRKARDVLAACSCAPDSTNCYGCLCNYQNQFAHDKLSRGRPLEYLNLLVDEFARGEPGPWRAPQPKPAREMAEAVMRPAGTDAVTMVVSSVTPGRIDGLYEDWFDVVKKAALAPGGAQRLKLILRKVPGRDTLADVIAAHRLAELKGLGVDVRTTAAAGGVQWIDVAGPEETAMVWQWEDSVGLGPDTASARRSRVGRAAAARKELPAVPSSAPLADLKPQRRFHHFTLPGGSKRDPLHGAMLGPVFAKPVRRLMIVDPYVLAGPKGAKVLDDLLRHVKFAAGAECLVKTQQLKEAGGRYFAGLARQTEEKTALESRYKAAGLRIEILYKLPEHDRIILAETADGETPLCHRVLLGQGLDAFSGDIKRYSEVVWFEMEREEFLRDWKEMIHRS